MVVRLDDLETRARLQQARTNLGTMIAQAKAAGQNVGLTAETGGSSIDQARGQVSQAQSSIRDAESEAASAASAINTASAAVRSASATLRQSKESIRRYTAELATARSNLQSVQKTVDAAQSQAKLSATNARRYTNLAKEGVVTERVRDEYVTAAEKDQANLQSAVANAESAKAQVDSRQSDLQHAKDQVAASQADMERSQAQLMSARDQASAANARILTAKGKKVQAEGVLREARTTPTQVAISKSKQTQSLSQIDEARAKVAEEMSTLANLFVVSPINGVVTTRIRDTGEVVTAGYRYSKWSTSTDYISRLMCQKVRLVKCVWVCLQRYTSMRIPTSLSTALSATFPPTPKFTPKEVQTPDERVKLVYAVEIYLKSNPGHRLTPGMPADAIIRWKENVGWQKPQYKRGCSAASSTSNRIQQELR